MSAWIDDEPAPIKYFNGTSWGDVPTSIDVNPVIPVTLVGNGATGIKTALVSNGETTSYAGPQFQAAFGLVSKHGAALGQDGNNVALYAGIESDENTGNTWGANFLNRLMPGIVLATQFFQAVEIDLQNDFGHLGEDGAISAPGSVGLQITASTNISLNGGVPYRNNAALFIMGRPDVWHYGIAIGGNSVKDASLYDFGHSTRSLLIAGSHAWGIDFTGTISSVAIRGKNDMPLLGAVNAAGDATVGLIKLDTLDQLILGINTSTAFFANKLGGFNFETASPAGATANRWYTQGALASGSPLLGILGSDTNPNAVIAMKGTGHLLFQDVNGFQFEVADPGGATVNRPYVRGSISGLGPVLGTVGDDTDVDLIFAPQGVGKLRFGTHAAIVGETLQGYITVKDFAGNTRKLAVVA